MEIGALTEDSFEVWMPFKDAEVLVRHVPFDELKEIEKTATEVFARGGRPMEATDQVEVSRLIGRRAVKGWRGLTMKGEAFPYTEENCDLLMTRWTEFNQFVNRACVDLQALVDEDRRRQAKN